MCPGNSANTLKKLVWSHTPSNLRLQSSRSIAHYITTKNFYFMHKNGQANTSGQSQGRLDATNKDNTQTLKNSLTTTPRHIRRYPNRPSPRLNLKHNHHTSNRPARRTQLVNITRLQSQKRHINTQNHTHNKSQWLLNKETQPHMTLVLIKGSEPAPWKSLASRVKTRTPLDDAVHPLETHSTQHNKKAQCNSQMAPERINSNSTRNPSGRRTTPPEAGLNLRVNNDPTRTYTWTSKLNPLYTPKSSILEISNDSNKYWGITYSSIPESPQRDHEVPQRRIGTPAKRNLNKFQQAVTN